MKNLKVIKLYFDAIEFENSIVLYSRHCTECCENHYLDFSDLTMADFDGLRFDLSNDNFFNRIENYGIELLPINGHSVKVPGYGENNGHYSSELDLILSFKREYDISECQDYF